MIKNHYESRYDANSFLQTTEYMIDTQEWVCEFDSLLYNRARKLNKKRIFLNPACTVRDEKELLISYDQS